MNVLKAVVKIASSENDTENDTYIWTEDIDEANLFLDQLSIETGRRQSSLIQILNSNFDDQPCAGRSFSKKAVEAIRREYLCDQLRARKDSFVSFKDLLIFCGTYNVNGRKELNGDLSLWLHCEALPDIYAIGFQEIVDLNAVNVAVSSIKSQQRTIMWEDLLNYYLQDQYFLVAKENLVGVLLFIFAKHQYRLNICLVEKEITRTGFRGTLGNKGGVAVRLQLFDSTICFVCSHLAAQRDNVAGRNLDYHSIIGKTYFKCDSEVDWEFRGILENSFSKEKIKNVGILDHDLVFWFGDLNYRIAEFVPTEEVFRRVCVNSLEYLRGCDQLTIERKRRNAFAEFFEGPLDFLPTYKFEVSTSEYDRKRAPAWCDRILWRTQENNANELQLVSYDSAEIFMSDHKPVSALFLSQIRKIDKEKHLRTYQQVELELKKSEIEGGHSSPQIDLSSYSVAFDNVTFMSEQVVSISIKNIGQKLAYLRFVPKLGDRSPAPSWLKILPYFTLLRPNDEATIFFTVFVDIPTARSLAAGNIVLQEIVILRLENGPDFYLEVSGSYVPSIFGMKLSSLLDRHNILQIAYVPNVPFEIWRLVDGIVRKGGLLPQVAYELFITPGDDGDIAKAMKCINYGYNFDDKCSAESLLQVLQILLRALPEPLVPLESIRILEKDFKIGPIQEWPHKFLCSLPPINQDLFLYLMSFFREVLQAQLLHVQSMSNVNQRLQEQAKALATVAADMMHPNEKMIVEGRYAAMTFQTEHEADAEDVDLLPPSPFEQTILFILRKL